MIIEISLNEILSFIENWNFGIFYRRVVPKWNLHWLNLDKYINWY